MAKRVFLKRSNVPGKLPDNKDDVGYGEVLVNYAAGEEFIGLKNSSNEYVRINAHPDAADVKFSGQHSDEGFTGETVESSIQQVEKVIVENESVTSAALNDVKGKISDVETSVSNKVDKVDGKGLSTNDYTTEEKTKLGGIEAGAQVNVKPDWNADSGSAAEILNKPTIPSKASEITFDGDHADAGFTGSTVQNSITQIESEIIKNELTISGSLNDINARISAIPSATMTGVTGDILSLGNDKLINATVSIDYGDATTESLGGKKAIKLLGKDGKVLSEIDASAFIKDGMINSVAFNPETHKLTITFNTDAGKNPIEIDLSTLVDTYKAGDGLSLGEDGTFSVNTKVIAAVGTSADTKESNTIVGARKYADDALATAKGTIDAYTVNGKAISENPTLKGTDIAIESHSDSGFIGTTVEESIKQIEREIVDNELATSGALNNVNSRISDAETAIGNKVDKVEGSSLMTEAEHTKLNGIAENAQVNVIESVKVNGTALNITEDKTVDVLLNASGITFDKSGHADSGFTGTTVETSIKQIEAEILANEETISGSLNDIDERIKDLSLGDKNIIEGVKRNGVALTPDAAKNVDIVVPESADAISFDTTKHFHSGFTAENVQDAIVDVEQAIIENEEVISGSLNELNEEIANCANVIEGVQVNGVDLSVSTEKKVNVIVPTKGSEINYDGEHPLTGLTGTTLTKAINDIEQTIVDNELVTATALNDLNAKIDEKSYSASDISFSLDKHYGHYDLDAPIDYTGTTVESSIVDLEEYVSRTVYVINTKADKKTITTILSGYTSMGTTTGSTSQSVTLDPDKFFIIGRTGALTIGLPSSAATDCLEYCCQFYVPSDSFTLTMPDNIYWQNGMVPSFEANSCCQLVIVNNCATIGTYKANS